MVDILSFRKIGINASVVNSKSGQDHEGHVGNKTFDSKPIGSLHQLEDDTIRQDSITILTFNGVDVFVISPFFVDCGDILFSRDIRSLTHDCLFVDAFPELTRLIL